MIWVWVLKCMQSYKKGSEGHVKLSDHFIAEKTEVFVVYYISLKWFVQVKAVDDFYKKLWKKFVCFVWVSQIKTKIPSSYLQFKYHFFLQKPKNREIEAMQVLQMIRKWS